MTGHIAPRDEGAEQTARIVEAVRRRRAVLGWSAQRLADEMTQAGIPWNADVVVNLEHGRRKSLRVHELLALALVLDVHSPLDLLVPQDQAAPAYPVTPGTLADQATVLAWCKGETGPLRSWLARPPDGSISDRVAERIRTLRMDRGLTAADLAERCAKAGMPRLTAQVLYKLEGQRDRQDRPPRPVTVDELVVLAAALQVPPSALLYLAIT
jgi:transcriptional regulator with XRE-family HTH domain